MPLEIEQTERYTLHKFLHPTGPSVRVYEMKLGQLGVMEDDGPYKGHVAMRAYGMLVSLNNPEAVWGVTRSSPELRARLLNPSAAITIVVR